MKKTAYILLFTILISTKLISADFNKHTLSLGFFDDKAGLSLISYKYNINKDSKNEYFIGVGTALLAFTGSIGWEYIYKEKNGWTSSIVLSEKAIAHLGFTALLTNLSITKSIRSQLTNFIDFKIGLNGAFAYRLDQPEITFMGYPFFGLDFNF
tara:strand:- start:1258 stop:1719 length:462 start_codon:yes stop_codon:yes gene_type:complete